MKKNKSKKSPIISIIAVILVVVLVFSGFQLITIIFSPNSTDTKTTTNTKTISRDGKDYYPRQDITVLMLTGIDQTGPVKSSQSYNNEGEADMIALAVFDEADKTFDVLVLNRDTMLNVPILGIGGKQAGTSFEQLALSHTYGTGLEDSCENTEKTVSNFLYGLNIDYYISMNMDAISILNDAVGGVTVNVTDDFSAVDLSITQGEFTLKGDQALTFIQTRKDVGNQMNISRMDRHKAYMESFVKAFSEKAKESDTFVLETYDDVAPYIVSDCSVNSLSAMLNRYADYELREIVTPKGENVLSDKYMEFYVDEEALDELIVKMFYTEK